jgi:hypothetical protein
MRVYLASPNNQIQANSLADMPVLLSYASYANWLDSYQQSFGRILIDSGAFSVYSREITIDLPQYKEWADRWNGIADAIAGLDDVAGDWKQSLKNYEVVGFPTIHDTDPIEILSDLLDIAKERGGWIGIGLKPPRYNKEHFVRTIADSVPDEIHIHGWALRGYTHIRRIDSVDSTNWWRDALLLRAKLPYLTVGETLEIIIKRYIRENRLFKENNQEELCF